MEKTIKIINRYKTVIEEYDKTVYVEEAIHRLVELYYTDHWRLHLYKILHSHFSILNSTNIGENNKGNQLRTNLSKCKTINDGKELLNELTILMNNYEYGDTTIKKEKRSLALKIYRMRL